MWRKEEEQVEERGRTGGGKRKSRLRKERESVCVRACVRACVATQSSRCLCL